MFAITGLTILLGTETRPQTALANPQVPFDHSECQYPDRTTNPHDGCDNSDPCDTQSAVKGGSGECLTQSNAEEIKKPKPTPVVSTDSFKQEGGK